MLFGDILTVEHVYNIFVPSLLKEILDLLSGVLILYFLYLLAQITYVNPLVLLLKKGVKVWNILIMRLHGVSKHRWPQCGIWHDPLVGV